jgi:hypothetical protein
MGQLISIARTLDGRLSRTGSGHGEQVKSACYDAFPAAFFSSSHGYLKRSIESSGHRPIVGTRSLR